MAKTLAENKAYWDKFYGNLKLSVPSQFCAMISVELPDNSTILEFGCGNGRDALYFASRGNHVVAMDLSEHGIEACSAAAKDQSLSHAHFCQGSLASHDDLAKQFELARDVASSEGVVGYSRFVMHSINDAQQTAFLSSVGRLMKTGERLYLEFRSKEDANLEKTFGNHYRRFVDTDTFVDEAVSNGFDLEYRHTGQGMARYKSEDPFVSRLIFTKN